VLDVTRGAVLLLSLLIQSAAPAVAPTLPPRRTLPAQVTVSLSPAIRTFDPARVLGAALDGHPEGTTAHLLTPGNVRAMLGAGLGPLTYRLRTELAVEAWHWNPSGRWSDSARREGYWVSNDRLGAPIGASFGYRLPRRGDTHDQANDDGYSRIDDGDTTTFWKSNPYLDPRLGAAGALPQWIYIDFQTHRSIGAARIAWGAPYPRRYTIAYWDGTPGSAPTDSAAAGRWRAFPGGRVLAAQGGNVLLRLSRRPVATRFVRLLLEESSHTAPPGSGDSRDSAGFALRELSLGELDRRGRFHDEIRHAPSHAQTSVLVSSTDPWHRAADRDPAVEQPGIDAVYASGLTRGLPMLLPTGVLYDIPENAAALLRYVRARRYAIRAIELGEEPDGQFVSPEDYASLYLGTAAVLRRVDPSVVLGGPSWQDPENLRLALWPAPIRRPTSDSWFGRFASAMGPVGMASVGFFSFEWYPFERPCEPAAPQVLAAPDMLRRALGSLRASGLPAGMPWLVSEYGYSVYGARHEVEIEGALVNADIVGTVLSEGGAAYQYGYEPEVPIREAPCDSWGNMMLLRADAAGQARDTLATWWAAWLINRVWLDSAGGPHQLLPVHADRDAPLGAYAVMRPDRRWAILLVNRDARRVLDVSIRVMRDEAAGANTPATAWQYSSREYAWRGAGSAGRPSRSLPPERHPYPGGIPPAVALPPWSITVIVQSR
jgi:hypothetical protein